MFILQYKVSITVIDLVVFFALFIFMLCTAVFLCFYRFSVNKEIKDLYKSCYYKTDVLAIVGRLSGDICSFVGGVLGR